MARSKAQKKRAHLIRNGRRDPAENRGVQPDFSTHVRKTPSLVERQRRKETKHKKQLLRQYL